jgi:hypothetical protein
VLVCKYERGGGGIREGGTEGGRTLGGRVPVRGECEGGKKDMRGGEIE